MKGSKTRSTRIPPQKYPTDGEKLERIPRGIDAPLHLNGNFGAEEDVHIGVHEWNADPPEDRAETPDGRTAPEGEEKILRAHGQKQGIADDAHPAFGWRHDGDKDASSQCRKAEKVLTRANADSPAPCLDSIMAGKAALNTEAVKLITARNRIRCRIPRFAFKYRSLPARRAAELLCGYLPWRAAESE